MHIVYDWEVLNYKPKPRHIAPFTTAQKTEALHAGYGPCPYCHKWNLVDFPCEIEAMHNIEKIMQAKREVGR